MKSVGWPLNDSDNLFIRENSTPLFMAKTPAKTSNRRKSVISTNTSKRETPRLGATQLRVEP